MTAYNDVVAQPKTVESNVRDRELSVFNPGSVGPRRTAVDSVQLLVKCLKGQ